MEEAVWVLLILAALALPYWLMAWYLCPKIGHARWLWLLVLAVPVLNNLFFLLLLTWAAGKAHDRLRALEQRP